MNASELHAESEFSSDDAKQGNIFDTFVKEMFGMIVVFVDFLVNYADSEFVEEIDLARIQSEPTHYSGQHGDERIVDLVFKCPLKHGGNAMVVVIFEHQTESLTHIPRKLLKYISAIWEDEVRAGKKLSIPYFIVLRTGKKPHHKPYPTLVDQFRKYGSGSMLDSVPRFGYRVIDVPALDLETLNGGPVLRLSLGILKASIAGTDEELTKVLSVLDEIGEGNDELHKEVFQKVMTFLSRVRKSQRCPLDVATIKKILPPKEHPMILSIFDEKYLEGKATGLAEGEARGEARGEVRGEVRGAARALIRILKKRLGAVPQRVEDRVMEIRDLVVIESLTEFALMCASLEEFEDALR